MKLPISFVYIPGQKPRNDRSDGAEVLPQRSGHPQEEQSEQRRDPHQQESEQEESRRQGPEAFGEPVR